MTNEENKPLSELQLDNYVGQFNHPRIPQKVDSVPGAFYNQQAFPTSVPSKNGWVAVSGMTLTDFFAGQYMAAGKLPDEAFRLARLAMKEREAGV